MHLQRTMPAAAVLSALATALTLTQVLPARATDSALPPPQLRLSFDTGESLAPGTAVMDVSGRGNHASVETAAGGDLDVAEGASTTRASAAFPAPCPGAPCGTAMLAVPDDDSLDPGTRTFVWGVQLRMTPQQAAAGSNLLQKGLWSDDGGQWKLQVDGMAARPSCVVTGTVAGERRSVTVHSAVAVDDDRWHRVACVRSQQGLAVVVDGEVQGWAQAPAAHVANDAPVTVGAKATDPRDADQFHGLIDNAIVRIV